MTNAIRGFSYALVEYVNQMLRLMTTLYLHYNPYERLCQIEELETDQRMGRIYCKARAAYLAEMH